MTDTLFLRALAALLIANSHLEGFYPIRRLAADGLLGDSLFFFLSGFGLVLSESRARRSFPDWYRRRVARIWPSVALAVLVFDLALGGGWRTWGWRDYVANFAWGHGYTFIPQILVMYALAFPIIRSGRRSALLAGILLLLPIYALGAIRADDAAYHWLHAAFYFQMMLFGGWLARRPGGIGAGGRREWLGLVGLLAAYLAARAVVASGIAPRRAFLPQMLIPAILYLLARLARSPAVARLMAHRLSGPILAGIGAMSLEVYLAHFQVIPLRPVASLPFPANVAAFLAVSLALAKALSWSSSKLRGFAAPGGSSPSTAVVRPATG